MDSVQDATRTDFSAMAERAQKDLQERPSFSIRARLTLGFSAWLIVSAGLAAASIVTISKIRERVSFTEAVQNYTFEVQQARRFEKNYFLYRTNLPDALEQVMAAQAILEAEQDDIRSVIGAEGLRGMTGHLVEYRRLMSRLQELDRDPQAADRPEYGEIEAGLRDVGADLVAEAENLVERERRAVDSLLLISQRIPLALVAVLILLIAYLTFFVGRQMLAPLARMMKTAQRVADGDFTPITAVRKYRDEFSLLAMAMNHMMLQLAHRQDLLVQAHKLKAVGTLTAGVAHELNNPINNIMLTAASLEEDYHELDDDERLEMVTDLVTESERSRRIVRNLLDFARESSIESSAIEPRRLVEETLQLATNQIKLAKVKVRGELEENLPTVRGDFQQLIQVLLNIVLNALDAMPNGGTLTVTLGSSQGGDFVSFGFTDTGTGISEHLLGSIFDPFFTTKPGAKGTGLGLSVSRGIVQQHGGDIQVRSQPGEGTTFTVLLPVTKVPAEIPEVWEEEEIPI